MRDDQEQVCGTCRHHRHMREPFMAGEWVCTNERSDYCALDTDYEDSCADWEGRDE